MSKNTDPLGFSEQWFSLRMTTKLQHQEFLKEFQEGPDKSTEHYRWRAFVDFMGKHNRLSANQLRKIYHLGELDTDWAMGGAMMYEVLKHRDCPSDILESAKNSDRKHLQKIAKEKA